MKRRMTRAEARAFVERWQRVNAAEIEELQRTPISLKVKQLGAMRRMAQQLGWFEGLAAGEEEVRDRWNRLRKAYRGRSTAA